MSPQGNLYSRPMSSCCRAEPCAEVFDSQAAKLDMEGYLSGGLDDLERNMLAALPAQAKGSTSRILEIGGGVGALQAELLKAGAGSGEVVELLDVYAPYARRLAEKLGIADRTSFHVHDLLAAPEAVESADVVLLNRVVCCSADGLELTAAAAELTRGALGIVFPRANAVSRLLAVAERFTARLFGRKYRIFIWSAEQLSTAAASAGLEPVAKGGSFVWRYLVFAPRYL